MTRIANVVLQQRGGAAQERRFDFVAIKIACANGFEYESSDESIFEVGGPIDTKRTESITMQLDAHLEGRSIEVHIASGMNGKGTVEVSGTDHDWVAGTFADIDEVIESTEKQNTVLLKYDQLTIFLPLALGLAILLVILSRHPNPSDTFLLLSILGTIIYILASVLSLQWASSAYPRIEFAFGPEHMRTERIRRNRWTWTVTVVIVPLVIAVIGLLVASLVSH